MKYTLLEIVQEILSDLDSDEVNSIDDTVEAQQVASIVRSTYLAMMSNRNWPHQKQSIQILSSGDPALPTHMKLQEDIKEMCFLNYNSAKENQTKKVYRRMRWLEPEEFLRRANGLNSDNDNVDIIQDTTGVEILIRNDIAPTVYTSFDDEHIVFDAYDSVVDTTLQESKVQAQAYVMPTWEIVDNFIPDLPDEAFTALVEEAKSKASFKLNQFLDEKAEQEAGRQQRWLSRKAWRVEGGIQFERFGRRGRKGHSSVARATFRQGKD